MKLIVKNRKIKNADGFLFGLKNFSTETNLITIEDLKKQNPNNIFISIDKNMFNKDLKPLEEALISLNELNIKGIFFYDLAVLSLVKRLNLNLNLIWNQNFLVTNYQTCNYYASEGVKGAVISSEITIEEIEELATNTNLDLFVNIFGYQMMALSKRKLISAYFDYLKEENKEDIHYMKEKEANYPIIEKDYGTKFLSKDILCGIRYINRLKKAGIKYLILDDNLINEETFTKIYNIFKESLKLDDNELLSLERKINSLLPTNLGFFNQKTIYKVKKND